MLTSENFNKLKSYLESKHTDLRIELDGSYYRYAEPDRSKRITNGICHKNYITIRVNEEDINWKEAVVMLLHEYGHFLLFNKIIREYSGKVEIDAWIFGLTYGIGGLEENCLKLEDYIKYASTCLNSYIKIENKDLNFLLNHYFFFHNINFERSGK